MEGGAALRPGDGHAHAQCRRDRPIAAELEAIDALASLDEIYTFVREGVLTSFVYGFYGISPAPDLADSSTYAAWYTGPALGLPNRDYYWTDDEGNEPIREAYRAMMRRSSAMAATPPRMPRTRRSGSTSWRSASPSRPAPGGFQRSRQLLQPAPHRRPDRRQSGFDWPAFLELLGIPEQETIVVTELEYLSAVDGILAATDLETLKEPQAPDRALTASALSEEMGQTLFDFYGTTLNGVEEREPLPERRLSDINGALGFAFGQLSRRAFPTGSEGGVEKWSPASSPPPGSASRRSTGCRRDQRDGPGQLDTMRVKRLPRRAAHSRA